MGRIQIDRHTVQKDLPQSSWKHALRVRIMNGQVVPIISHLVSNDVVMGLGRHVQLFRAFVKHLGHGGSESTPPETLPQVTQQVTATAVDPIAVKEICRDFFKSWLYKEAEDAGIAEEILKEIDQDFDQANLFKLCQEMGYPQFKRGLTDPLLILANFPLPIYLTTGYDNFAELALRIAGKQPRTALYPWRDGLETQPFFFDEQHERRFDAEHKPTVEQPLVYHLQGFYEYPNSLVLTEDDYFEFLIAFAQNANASTDPLSSYVRTAIADSSLMILGYKLRTWEFRALFWGLIKPFQRRYRNISVQMEPDDVDKEFLKKYLDKADFDVYEGDVYEFMNELNTSVDG